MRLLLEQTVIDSRAANEPRPDRHGRGQEAKHGTRSQTGHHAPCYVTVEPGENGVCLLIPTSLRKLTACSWLIFLQDRPGTAKRRTIFTSLKACLQKCRKTTNRLSVRICQPGCASGHGSELPEHRSRMLLQSLDDKQCAHHRSKLPHYL